ncbi:MAG: glucose-6-phosphate isomerase [Gammaproteobacteria bacterium]|nr:glucose-6-phosphate isomerase [Gammaproteobacteria bacterium]
MTPLNIPEWQSLVRHYSDLKYVSMREQFALDSGRFDRFSAKNGDLLLDYSKNRITQETVDKLIDLAKAVDMQGWIERMFTGETINHTEGRAVLHTALRNRSNTPVLVDGQDVMPMVNAVLAKMRQFTEQVHSGAWRGYTGKKITDIVNIGIGGSDLGPAMICDALEPYGIDGMDVHFVSNVDGTDLSTTLEKLNPETTLFVVASKTFTTQETITNANSARAWFLKSASQADVAKHFVAVSTNAEKVAEFGIDTANMFEIWDWVGGRYSLWSAIGLPIALYVGMDNFERLLDGGHQMDQHFRNTPLAENIPVIMGMLGIWYINFFSAQTHAIVPYDHSLARFPSHMQQLDMESNGKSINNQGRTVNYATGPMVWGGLGNQIQHSYYQLLCQGTHKFAIDVISLQSLDGELINEICQENKQILNQGVHSPTDPSAYIHGMVPMNHIKLDCCTPFSIGELIALYEHKIFTQSVIWDINPFDQPGVESAKQASLQSKLTSATC